MHRAGAWGLCIALLAVWSSGWATAADDPPVRPDAAPWAKRSGKGLMQSGSAASDRPVEKKANKEKEPAAAKSPKASDPAERTAAEKARAGAAFLRRMAVCDKLKQIGLDTGNDALQRMADDLLERAQAAYSQRIGELSLENDEMEAAPNSAKKTARDERTVAKKEKP